MWGCQLQAVYQGGQVNVNTAVQEDRGDPPVTSETAASSPCSPPMTGHASATLLDMSPMPVESSPSLSCPTPCHLLPNCTSCLDSKGVNGGWQHCVWSSSLQHCLSASYLPLRCMAGGCGLLLRGPQSCSLGYAQAPQCSLCLRHPHCGWWGGGGDRMGWLLPGG